MNNNAVHILAIDPASGKLGEAANHIFPTGNRPNSVAFDHTGNFFYVTNGDYPYFLNGGSNNISAYAFDPKTGMLAQVPGSPYGTGQAPASIVVPASM